MISYERVSDFLMTGCAVAPALAFYLDRPEFALLSHIVLLIAGLLFAAGDRDAPFRRQEHSRRKTAR